MQIQILKLLFLINHEIFLKLDTNIYKYYIKYWDEYSNYSILFDYDNPEMDLIFIEQFQLYRETGDIYS